MANVYPFRALRYSPEKAPLQQVVTQPYDKISREMQDRYYGLHPQNIVRLVLGKSNAEDAAPDNVYTRAAGFIQEWRRSGVIVQLDKPAFFVYFQRFTIPGSQDERVRKGFIGLGGLEDYRDKVVFPHERTLTGPKQDRLELLRHTRTQFEQIFMLYEDPARRIDSALDGAAQGPPDMHVRDEYGVDHSLWIVNREPLSEFIRNEMLGKKLIIADGHHRYETALAYRDEMRAKATAVHADAAYERMPMAFFNMHSPGLTILPTHRVLSGLKFDESRFWKRAAEDFDVTDAPTDPAAFRDALTQSGQHGITIGVCINGEQPNALLKLKASMEAELDVIVLHKHLIENCLGITEEAVKKESYISYMRDFGAAINAVQKGEAQIAFLLNPTRLEQMRDIAYAGEVMPQKSTDFYPKILSGLIMYSLL
jgi:uncharacterized protein (DUF1015 family)